MLLVPRTHPGVGERRLDIGRIRCSGARDKDQRRIQLSVPGDENAETKISSW